MNIFILHPGKASYPEIAAYREYFSPKLRVFDGTLAQYSAYPDKKNTILWCIMGFFPRIESAGYVVHDYRSLSTGRLAAAKDFVKSKLNPKPDLRIFQNSKMREVMGFHDDVPSLLIPMGIPNWLIDFRHDSVGVRGTYCYIGEMSTERGFNHVLDAFLASRSIDETLLLIGQPERGLLDRYQNEDGLLFTGRLSQADALAAVARSDFAISYFPYHRPHRFQTPTKLLEYAALGSRILANDSPGNVDTARALDIEIGITGARIFDDRELLRRARLVSRPRLDIAALSWHRVIEESGVSEILPITL